MSEKPYPFEACKECCNTGADIDPSEVVSDVTLVAESDGSHRLNVLRLDGSGGFDSTALASKKYVDDKTSGTSPGGSIVVDDKFDIDSTNPIQNKVVANFVETAVTVFNIENEGTSEENIWSKNYNGSAVETHLPLVSRLYVDNAIGDIETTLENIITKYGLGGDGV